MAALSQDNIRALEQIRQRLLGLHTALTALQQDLYAQQPLPSWSSLQSHSALVSNNLQALSQQLAEQQHLLSLLVVHPLPQLPNHQSHIIEQMLRTKLEPDVEEWVEKDPESISPTAHGVLSERDRNELWQWAPSAANMEARKQKWGADYTLAEKEMGIDKVVTGLRRELAEPPEGPDEEDEYEEVTDDEDEGDGDRMEIVEAQPKAGTPGLQTEASKSISPQMPLSSIHKFMVTGKIA